MQILKGSSIKELNYEIQAHTGIIASLQSLLYVGKIMQDNYTIQNYGIVTNLAITLNLKLRGGFSGYCSKGKASFKDVVKQKGEANTKPSPTPYLPRPYIVEQKSQILALTVYMPEVNELCAEFYTKAVIYKFNGFWPR